MRDTLWPILQGIGSWIAGTLVPTIGNIILAFWHWRDTVAAGFTWVKDHWPLLLGIITGPIGLAVTFIVSHFNAVVSFVQGLPARIAAAAAGMWNGLLQGLGTVLDKIGGALDALLEKLHIIQGSPGNFGGLKELVQSQLPHTSPSGGPGVRHLATGGIALARPG